MSRLAVISNGTVAESGGTIGHVPQSPAFEHAGEWFFMDHRGAPVGGYKDEETALTKCDEYQLYLHAH